MRGWDGSWWFQPPACRLHSAPMESPIHGRMASRRCLSVSGMMRASWIISTRMIDVVGGLDDLVVVVVAHRHHRRTEQRAIVAQAALGQRHDSRDGRRAGSRCRGEVRPCDRRGRPLRAGVRSGSWPLEGATRKDVRCSAPMTISSFGGCGFFGASSRGGRRISDRARAWWRWRGSSSRRGRAGRRR